MALLFDCELDVRGAKSPVSVVRARQAINEFQVGQVLRVTATDWGFINDFKGRAQVAKNIELFAQQLNTVGGQTVYVHCAKRKGENT